LDDAYEEEVLEPWEARRAEQIRQDAAIREQVQWAVQRQLSVDAAAQATASGASNGQAADSAGLPPTPPPNPPSNSRTNTTNSRLGVCITGQLSRLELTSKVEHLLKVSQQGEWAGVDVVLVLDTATASYVNTQGKGRGRAVAAECYARAAKRAAGAVAAAKDSTARRRAG
jgi:hypothetical protein